MSTDRREGDEKVIWKEIKTIQRNNPKKFHWIVGGIVGWGITGMSLIIWIVCT